MVLVMTHENEQTDTPENEAPKRSVVTGDRLAISGDEDGYSRTGRDGYSLSGNRGLAVSGDCGMSIAGVDGIVRAGRGGMVVLSNADEQGIRYVVAADINEDAVPLPDTFYRLDGHAFVEAFDVDEASLDASLDAVG